MFHQFEFQPASSARLVVTRAEVYLRARLDTPVAVSQLSHAVGITERALRRAFQNVYGTSPKRFMVTERLWAAHRALREHPSDSVTQIAVCYGFCELGRFAGSYRKVFGETPSDTRRKNRR
jgi:AraC family transcriptional regulator, ethanolamine operon transcriptional activator